MEINNISERHIRGVDKWNRMFVGLASNLIKYEDDIIYLKVKNTEKVKLSSFETAESIVKTWIMCNNELKDAKGWIAYFYRTNASTGFMMSFKEMRDKSVIENVVNQMKVAPELKLINIFSGVV